MRFTRQDLLTFAIGLAFAVAWPLVDALRDLDSGEAINWRVWGFSLFAGVGAAAGRYLATYLTQRGLVRDEPEPARFARDLGRVWTQSDFETTTAATTENVTVNMSAPAARSVIEEADLMTDLQPRESISQIKQY